MSSQTAITADAVAALLAGLGSDASEVYATLSREKCRGVRMHACGCPCAVYLGRKLPGAFVGVTREVTIVGDLSVPNPSAVGGFIRRFDMGEFPSLDVEAEACDL